MAAEGPPGQGWLGGCPAGSFLTHPRSRVTWGALGPEGSLGSLSCLGLTDRALKIPSSAPSPGA